MDRFTFVVHGKPKQKGNSRAIRRRGSKRFVGSSDKTIEDEKSLHLLVRAVAAKLRHKEPWTGPVRVDVDFVFSISAAAASHGIVHGDWCTNRNLGDRGNLLKMLEDAMKGIVYVDDSQVAAGEPRKFFGPHDCTVVRVMTLPYRATRIDVVDVDETCKCSDYSRVNGHDEPCPFAAPRI